VTHLREVFGFQMGMATFGSDPDPRVLWDFADAFGLPVVVLAALGVLVALVRRRDGDLLCLAWLAGHGDGAHRARRPQGSTLRLPGASPVRLLRRVRRRCDRAGHAIARGCVGDGGPRPSASRSRWHGR
jgi:hypothetical protein